MKDETPVDLPGIRLARWAIEQVERRRLLKERMTGKAVRFGEVLTEVIESALERVTIA